LVMLAQCLLLIISVLFVENDNDVNYFKEFYNSCLEKLAKFVTAI